MEISSIEYVVNNMIHISRTIDKQLKELNEQLQSTNFEQQDLLHDIEFSRFSACEGYLTMKKLQEVRQRRRAIKNNIELLENFKCLQDKSLNEKLSSSMSKYQKTKDEMRIRVYCPRIRRDLKLCREVNNG